MLLVGQPTVSSRLRSRRSASDICAAKTPPVINEASTPPAATDRRFPTLWVKRRRQ